jgi:hypothetical protein
MWKTMRKHGGSGNSYPFQTKLVDSQAESSKPQFFERPTSHSSSGNKVSHALFNKENEAQAESEISRQNLQGNR